MAEEIKRFEMVSATDVGRVRSHNEDSIAADPDIGLATLADGMGGYNAGEVASGIAVAMIPAEMRKLRADTSIDQMPDSEIEKRVDEQARKVNTAIYNAAQKESQYAGMGTTLVFACWHGNKVTVGHLGDSRMYRVRGATIEALTKDHSWIQEQIDKGLMTYDQARASKKKNLVTRACGIDPNVTPTPTPTPTPSSTASPSTSTNSTRFISAASGSLGGSLGIAYLLNIVFITGMGMIILE